MGLDMYLRGVKNPFNDRQKDEDGFEITAIEIELGYWRKHPDLHGFIVQQFAGGKDDCQKIYLNAKAIETILEAVKVEALPLTTGFFFGTSSPSDRLYSIEVFEKALKWINRDKDIRYVYYQASW